VERALCLWLEDKTVLQLCGGVVREKAREIPYYYKERFENFKKQMSGHQVKALEESAAGDNEAAVKHLSISRRNTDHSK
jgi:hypothetical protein